MSGGLNILAYVKLYPPTTNAGAELMLHEVLLELQSRGHKVTVAQPDPKIKHLDGIKIISYQDAQNIRGEIDIIFTQNHDTHHAVALGNVIRKPVVHFIHNDKAVRLFRISRRTAKLIVANSRWVANSFNVAGVPKMVLNPPTDPKKYFVKRNKADRITFINLIDIKGVDLFWELAKTMPHKKFLAVKGGYGEQKIPDKVPSNVQIIDNTDDMKKIYEKTRILLVPSKYESWGRVGIEAMISGIPVIASDTPGLRESLGNAGIFVTNPTLNNYYNAINSLDDIDKYNEHSSASFQRAQEVIAKFKRQVDTLENYLFAIKG